MIDYMGTHTLTIPAGQITALHSLDLRSAAPLPEQEAEEGVQSGAELLAARADAFATEPIYRLPALAISWARPRSDAKALVGRHVQSGRAHSSPLRPTPLARPDPRRRVA